MITVRSVFTPGIVAILIVFGVACSSGLAGSPTPGEPAPAISKRDAVRTALTASQDIYDNLVSLGTVGVTAKSEAEPRQDVSSFFVGFELRDFGDVGAWLVEVRFAMVGAPSGAGTSYTLFAIDAGNGPVLAQRTSPVPWITGIS